MFFFLSFFFFFFFPLRTVRNTVVKKLDYAVVGLEPGASKMNKLKELPHVKLINEDQLFELIAKSPAKKLTAEQQQQLRKEAANSQLLAPTTKPSPMDVSTTSTVTKPTKKESPSKDKK
jgi:UDP-glucose 6-dehydrogenase